MTTDMSFDGAEWHEISSVLGAYLHQDWPEEYDDDVWKAVDDFRRKTSSRTVAVVANQVRTLRDMDLDDSGIEAAFLTLGLEYDPREDGQSYEDFLATLESFLA